MVRYLILALLPFLALFLQSTLFATYTLGGAVPDLVLIFVTFYALMNSAGKGAVYGFFCGLLEDLFTGRFVGMNAISKALVAYLVGRYQVNVFKENIIVGVGTVAVATLLNSIILFIVSLGMSEIFHVDSGVLTTVIYQIIYNSVLSVPLYLWYYNSVKSGWLRYNGER